MIDAKHYPTILLIAGALDKFRLSSKILQAGILAVCSTETAFHLRAEMSYRNTPLTTIRSLFGERVAAIDDNKLAKLICDDVAFFDLIYSSKAFPKSGNNAVGDGYLYRGRGFNQITFKNNYDRYGLLIGKDLVTHPELLNKPDVAADALAAFFSDGFKHDGGVMQSKYGVLNYKEVDTLQTATVISFQLNAGWKTDLAHPKLADELRRQLTNVEELYRIITNP